MTTGTTATFRAKVPALILACFAVATLSSTSQIQAQRTRPFAVVGAGVAPTGVPLPGLPGRDHWAVGVATQLGIYYGEGGVQTDSAVPQPNGTIQGEFGSSKPFVFHSLGGKLATYYGRTAFGASVPGEVTLTIVEARPDGTLIVTAHFVAEFVIQPDLSTGRFRGATGSWLMIADSEPFVLGSSDPFNYSWYGFGSITTRR